MNQASFQRQFLSQLEVLTQNFGFLLQRAFVLALDVWRSKQWYSYVCLRGLACSSRPIDERNVRFWWSQSDNLFVSSQILTLRRLAVVTKTIRISQVLKNDYFMILDRMRPLTRILTFVEFLGVSRDFCVNWSVSVLIKRSNVYCSKKILKSLKYSITITHLFLCGSIRVYAPTPPPPFREGDSWIRFLTSCLRTPFEDQAIS